MPHQYHALASIPEPAEVSADMTKNGTCLDRAGEELLGCQRGELIGRNDHDLFPKKEADFFVQKDREVLASREVVEVRVRDGALDRTSLDGLVDRVEVLPDRVLCYTADADAAAAVLVERGLARAGVYARRATLEDVFLRLTGRTLID
jgi:hypothetical protein